MDNSKPSRTAISLLSFKEVQQLTGLSRSTIYRQMKSGRFPKPRVIASRKVGFLQIELEDWIQERETP